MSAQTVSGDDLASDVCREHYDAVYRLCLATLHCEHDAADATQLTFERVLRRLDALDVGSDFDRYVLRTARFACVDVARVRQRTRSDDTETRRLGQVPAAAQTEVDVVSDDTCRRILDGIGERQGGLLVERVLLGFDVADMARQRGRTARSLSVSLHRARRAAADFTLQNGLRGLTPAGAVSWWWSRWRERLEGLVPAQSAALVAAGVVALSVSPVAVPSDVQSAVLSMSGGSVVTPVALADMSNTGGSPASGDPVDEPLSASSDPGRRQSPSSQLVGSDDGAGRLPVAPVAMPGPVGTSHQDRPDDPHHAYGIEVAGVDVVTVETDEEGDELSGHDDRLCTTFAAAPGGTCTGGDSGASGQHDGSSGSAASLDQ